MDEKACALYEFTKDALSAMIAAGVDIGIVQIGNETTTGMCGERAWVNIAKLMSAGSRAVREVGREFGKEIMIAIHFTNPERGLAEYHRFGTLLESYKVDYDIFATSLISLLAQDVGHLTTVHKHIALNFGKR